MELFQFQLCFLLAIAVVFATTIFLVHKTQSNKKKLAPKASGGWPILGHLPLLSSSKLPHKVLATMADTYGPIFRIDLGVNQALVISSSEMAKACLHINDKSVLGRGKSIGVELMGYNYAMFGFGPYDRYWRHMRKIVMHELLSNNRCNKLTNVVESEVQKSVRKMIDKWLIRNKNNVSNKVAVLVDLTNVLGELTLNLIVRIVSGKQLAEDGDDGTRIRDAINDFFEHIGCFAIGDALPFLRWMDLGGQEKAMKKCFKELDVNLQGWLDEHKEKRCNNNDIKKNDVGHDFMDIMLSVLDDDAIIDFNYDADTINKSTCLAMILGGSDTTKVALTWTFSLLLNNPQVLKRAKEEIINQVGKENQVTSLDIPKLEYLGAIVKESLRLYPPAPLMGPREFIEDCLIGDYYVKSGTKLIVNVSKISRDPQVWEDPLEFHPERFLHSHKNVDVKGQHFELIPFGAGRRICPGMSFGLQVIHLTLATFLHAFEFSIEHNDLVDLSERFGLTSMKAKPLQVVLNLSVPSFEAYI